ncbi:D-alanyl-D-alanine carboxypeptidase family protein [Streptomyces sp. NBC_00096]|uniref:D-alanyl-D-alanine carboxypeptidase family protein n=1 Tax=Streptomyces sp. NBC_00096 TaxID=2975650 RepID=UPI003250481F
MSSAAAPPSPPGRRGVARRRLAAVAPALTAVLCTAAVALSLVLFGRPAAASELVRHLPGTPAAPQWPATGQAAFAVAGAGEYASPGQTPVPAASTAKVMTAYVFLSRHPLRPGQDGPSFTVSAAEAARYRARSAGAESVVPLRPGQRMTERDALRALLAASANNVADELARWYGPVPTAFVGEMNRTAQRLGMDETHYTGPSGLAATTVSTAADQVKLLRAALRLPDFAALASSSYTDVHGHRHANTNPMLGEEGVFAGKTGTTRAAGRNLVFAAHRDIAGRSRLVVGAVLAQPRRATLTTPVRQLLAETDRALVAAPVVRRGEVIASLRDGVGRAVPLSAAHDLSVTGPPGARVTLTVEPGAAPADGAPAGTAAARAVVTAVRPVGEPGAGDGDGAHAGPGAAGPVRDGTSGAADATYPEDPLGGSVGLVTDAPVPRLSAPEWLVLRLLPWPARGLLL